MRKKTKRTITLLEIMIVVLLIGIIGTVLGSNMKGSLDRGKAFKSEEGAKQVRDILVMEVDDEDELKNIVDNKDYKKIKEYLKNSGLVSDVDKLMVDGWKKEYTYSFNNEDELEVVSDKLKEYDAKKNQKEKKKSKRR